MPSSDGSSSLSEMEIQDPDQKKKGFFGDLSSNKTFMKISGIVAGVAVLVLVIVLPVYFTVIEPKATTTDKPNDDKTTTDSVTTQGAIVTFPPTFPPPYDRFDCYPESDATQEKCENRGCTWDPSGSAAPSCFFFGPRVYSAEDSPAVTANAISSEIKARDDAPDYYGEQFSTLTVKTTYISSSTLRIKIYPVEKRYEVPLEHPAEINKPADAMYAVEHSSEGGAFGVKVRRLSTSNLLFDSSVGELMYSDQFLQISIKVASEYIYGFGEHMHESFKHSMEWKTYGMFSRDQGVGTNVNLYGVHPYFMCMEEDSNAYGVFFVNSNAMDVTLQPTPAITYRTVGGVMDFYVFLGPTPEQVTDQYTALIGRPHFPPYWSLGFQLSRYGYENLENLTRVVNRNLGRIPYEIQYSDIDYMERQMDFTIDSVAYDGLEEFVTDLKSDHKMRYIIILDPAITGNETAGSYPPYDGGVENDVFIKTPEGDIAWGKVWPDLPNITVDTSQSWDYQTENYRAFAAFPDFYKSETSDWWKNLTVDFHKRIEFDGLWIDMNEPASFVHGSPSGCPADSDYDNPPYHPKLASENLYDKTLCMQSKQRHPTTASDTEHYNLHSLYGLSQSLPTLEACRASTGERCIVISRSTYPGSGKYVGHWLGDNTSSWDHLAASIIGMLEFNLFGIPYIGADVCGFFQDTTYELCLRWMQLGAFYPFDRNHNGLGFADQDPGAFNETFVDASRKVLETRYTLLPYLYTLFYDAQQTGATVVRPLMNQFPTDKNTYTIDKQFLWGPAILITPVLTEGAVEVQGYFPDARWYDYYSGNEEREVGMTQDLAAPIDHINLHVLGGYIIPTQEPANTTYYSRKNPFGLIVALDEENKASGKLFWDDGTSIDTIGNSEYILVAFTCESSTLTGTVMHTYAAAQSMLLGTVRIMGAAGIVTSVTVDGVNFTEFTQNGEEELLLNNVNLDLTNRFEIRWELNNEWKKIDCMPSLAQEPNEADCEARGCLWQSDSSSVSPRCYYPYDDASKIPSYKVDTTARAGTSSYILRRNTHSQMYGTPADTLQLDVEYQTNNRLHFKLKDATKNQFEIPNEVLDLTSNITSDESKALYRVDITNDVFSIKITRNSTGKTIFDTSAGPLVYEDKYLELSTILPSQNVFGFGEHNHKRYRHDLNWKRWAIFTRDVAPVDEWNLYGHQTFYMAIDDVETGSAVGVYLHNSNAMDVTLKPSPALTYRVTGGVLDFYIFIGDSQEEVVKEYHKLVGLPVMPPYWGLGFQLSRWGYSSLDEVKGVYQEMRDAMIPYDIQYGDIDYMDAYKSFTYDEDKYADLPDFVDELHAEGMRYVIIVDPGIKIESGYKAYDEGIADDIFIKNPEGTAPVTSEVWPGETHHPDFTHPNVSQWWYNQCWDFYNNSGVKYDALWIDMNEPANFQTDDPDKLQKMNCTDEYNKPPYMPKILWYGVGLHDKTICMENQQYLGLHYDFHSLYGHTMSTTSYEVLEKIKPDVRSFIVTRSTFAGTGKYAQHWLGDNQSQWRQLPWPIPAMFEFNLFGFPYVGADVCGFWYNTTAELCQRWMQVGAFYPFSRNHNAKDMNPQQPTAFGPNVTASSKKALETRYSIIPYMYTLFYRVSQEGGTVVRALVHEFPSDKNTWDADRQFLLGSGFLITPVLEEGATKVTGYFPATARWFDFYTGEELMQTGKFVSLEAPLDHINLHVRGGTIIPMQNPDVTTTKSRTNAMSLLVPLDESESAVGELYWDDGEARNVGERRLIVGFTCGESVLNFTITNSPVGFDVSALHFEKVTILGIKKASIDFVTVDASEGSGSVPSSENFKYENKKLEIYELNLRIDQPHEIEWS